MKTVIINALQYGNKSSGVGIVIRELFGSFLRVTHFPCSIVLSKDSPDFATLGVAVICSPYRKAQNLRRIYFQSVQLGLRYCKNSVLLTVDSKIPFIIPRSCKIIPIVTDLAIYRIQETYQVSRVLLWKLQYAILKRKAAHFIAISEYTKSDLVELLDIDPLRISVIPCAAPPFFSRVTDMEKLSAVRAKYRLPKHYILFVGNFNPRKNLNRLLSAFDRMKSNSDLPHQLVIVGEYGWKFNRIEAMQGIIHSDDVCFIGYVPDEDLPAVYTMTDLFVFPTLYEGFGIPIIEAQRCGAPVLTSNCSAMPEVGGDAAVYADPLDVEDICNKMRNMLENRALRAKLSDLGYENAKRFSWEKSADLLNNAVKEVLAHDSD